MATKVVQDVSVTEAFMVLKDQLEAFKLHVFIKLKQTSHFDELKTNVSNKKVLLQVDFSENVSLMSQNEIQSAHWANSQATVFTAHLWAGNNVSRGYVIVSDFLQHNKLSVHAFMRKLFQELKILCPGIEEIDVYSDGAASQFKQRYLFQNLNFWQSEFKLKLRWHYFATSHGKGVVDGHGGTIKRLVWRQVKSGACHATIAREFFTVAEA